MPDCISCMLKYQSSVYFYTYFFSLEVSYWHGDLWPDLLLSRGTLCVTFIHYYCLTNYLKRNIKECRWQREITLTYNIFLACPLSQSFHALWPPVCAIYYVLCRYQFAVLSIWMALWPSGGWRHHASDSVRLEVTKYVYTAPWGYMLWKGHSESA